MSRRVNFPGRIMFILSFDVYMTRGSSADKFWPFPFVLLFQIYALSFADEHFACYMMIYVNVIFFFGCLNYCLFILFVYFVFTVTVLCGIIAAAGQFKHWELGIFAMYLCFVWLLMLCYLDSFLSKWQIVEGQKSSDHWIT